jgi:hypothetical protein
MDEGKIKEIVSNMVFWSGKKDMAIDEIAMIQPGLARIMPEIGCLHAPQTRGGDRRVSREELVHAGRSDREPGSRRVLEGVR